MLRQAVSIASEEFRYAVASARHRFSVSRHLQRVLVNGSPKTGTTWMLNLITSVPGYRIAPGYNFRGDIKRYLEVSPGEVVHGHDPGTGELWKILLSKDIKVILTVRDPRDQAVSRMFHVRRDTNHRANQKMREMNEDAALLSCIEGNSDEEIPGTVTMLKLTRSWLNGDHKAFCVKYEDLISDPVCELRKVLQYLGEKVNDNLVQAIVERNRFERLSIRWKIWKTARKPGQHNASSHFRKGIVGDWKNYFKEVHIQRFKEVAGDALIELGYEKDYDW